MYKMIEGHTAVLSNMSVFGHMDMLGASKGDGKSIVFPRENTGGFEGEITGV